MAILLNVFTLLFLVLIIGILALFPLCCGFMLYLFSLFIMNDGMYALLTVCNR